MSGMLPVLTLAMLLGEPSTADSNRPQRDERFVVQNQPAENAPEAEEAANAEQPAADPAVAPDDAAVQSPSDLPVSQASPSDQPNVPPAENAGENAADAPPPAPGEDELQAAAAPAPACSSCAPAHATPSCCQPVVQH
ncbi:MAG: hypothetical protein KDA59_26435, partial [Planctomycetales bacterium]|nr:hypothetical protein [Planctomycetales bacterium]